MAGGVVFGVRVSNDLRVAGVGNAALPTYVPVVGNIRPGGLVFASGELAGVLADVLEGDEHGGEGAIALCRHAGVVDRDVGSFVLPPRRNGGLAAPLRFR